MKTRILGLAFGVGALWLWAPGCSQPNTQCTIGTASYSPYVAKYTLLDGDPESACGGLVGDYIGMQQYNPADGDVPDPSVKYLAIKVNSMGATEFGAEANGPEFEDPDETHKPYSLGTFNAIEPDGSDLCTVPSLSPAQISLPEVPYVHEGSGGFGGAGGFEPLQRELSLAYEWSNVNIYVTPALPGNQAEGTMRYTENGCTATYHVVMLWPAVGCEKYAFFRSVEPDPEVAPPCDPCAGMDNCAACDPNTEEDCEALPTCSPDPKLCDEEPDPEPQYGLPYGSGIAPDLNVVCDPDLLLCTLNSSTIPALK